MEGKIFKSDSNFTDWQEYAKMDSKPFYTMYDPQGNLWAADNEGTLFKSSDNWKTYEKYQFPDKEYKIYNMYKNNGYLIMDVIGEDVAIYTSDSGESWETVYNSQNDILTDLCIVNDKLMYMSNYEDNSTKNYISTDGGNNFEPLQEVITNGSTELHFCFKDETYGFAYGEKTLWAIL